MGDLQSFPAGGTLLPSPAEPATATGEADRPAEHAESAMSAGRSTRMKTNTTKAAAAKAEPVAKQPEAKTDKPATPAKAAKQPEAKPAKAAKQPAKPATPAKAAKQPEAKPAKAAKQPAKPATPVQAAKQPEADGKSWIGTAIEGKGWRIVFDDATQRTRVTFTGDPSAKQKAAVEAAGFYWSAQLKSWNKKLTYKAYRASLALRDTLTAIA